MPIAGEAFSPEELLRKIVTVEGDGTEVNLAALAQRRYGQNIGANPLLNPRICERFVYNAAHVNGVAWTWGGYREDRRQMWRQSYIEETGFSIHAGIDINVGRGTPVNLPFSCDVILVDDDTPELHGWGPRVGVVPHQRPDLVLLLGHLAGVAVRVGDQIGKVGQIAVVGGPPNNGNWYSHLHVQAVEREFFQNEIGAPLTELDGYYPPEKRDFFERVYPDPIGVLCEILGA